ncbi:MAG: hypothetical protein RL722_1316, partial [Pseudomonadota bacterium]
MLAGVQGFHPAAMGAPPFHHSQTGMLDSCLATGSSWPPDLPASYHEAHAFLFPAVSRPSTPMILARPARRLRQLTLITAALLASLPVAAQHGSGNGSGSGSSEVAGDRPV